MDTLLVNLVLMGYIERDLSALVEYCEAVSEATGVPIPRELSGRRHATRSAPRPACTPRRSSRRSEERHGARRRRLLGRAGGRWSGASRKSTSARCPGESNVHLLAREARTDRSDEVVDRILAEAKRSDAVLSEEKIRAVLRQ